MLSKRLLASALYLKGFNCLADCGTDHGYLPIYAVKHGYVNKAYASDNKEKPLENAKKNIMKEALNIETILADGLPYLSDEIDVVSVLGMGGRLISDILTKADLSNVTRLVLSPNSEAEVVRDFLEKNGFEIIAEEVILDHKKYYQIIVSEKGNMVLSDTEKEFGPINIKKQSDQFRQYVKKQIRQLEKAILNVKDKTNHEMLQKRIDLLKEVIS